MPIRVLHIIGSLKLGGAQMCVKQLVEHNDDPDIEYYIYPLRSRQIDIPIDKNIIKLPYANYDPRKFFAIFSLCKKYNIDIIHAHLHKPILGALLTRFFIDIPVIVHEHGSIAIEGPQYTFYRLMLRLLKKKARLFIAVSQSAANLLSHHSKIESDRINVVYNAVDLNKFTPDSALREKIRQELAFSTEDIVIGYVGRLSQEKGPDLLIDAFDLLSKTNPKYRLVLLGRGRMEEHLHRKAKVIDKVDRIRFLGFQKNVHELMNIFDIAVIPSRRDAFPLIPLEFMSMKIPLVSSNVSGLAEIVKHEYNALVPKDNTPPQISECIEKFIHDPSLQQVLTENALRTVQNFSIPRFVRQINEIYRKIADID